MSRDGSFKFAPQPLDAQTTRRVTNFLFQVDIQRPPNLNDDEWKELKRHYFRRLQAQTNIKGVKTLQLMSYYGVLMEALDLDLPLVIGGNLMRLFMAVDGERSEQATNVMRGGLPKEFEVRTGQL